MNNISFSLGGQSVNFFFFYFLPPQLNDRASSSPSTPGSFLFRVFFSEKRGWKVDHFLRELRHTNTDLSVVCVLSFFSPSVPSLLSILTHADDR